MDDRRTYMNKQLVRPDPPSKSGGEVSYAELHLKTLSDPPDRRGGDRLTSAYSKLNFRKGERHVDEDEDISTASRPAELRVTAQTDGLASSCSELKFGKEEPLTDEDEDPPIASKTRRKPTTTQTAVQARESKVKIGNGLYRLICLLCLITLAFIVTVATFSIHVSQIRQSNATWHRNYNELNSTLQSKLSALNFNLSDLKRIHSDLRHQFTEMETKYRSANETKAQICEFLTSRREQTCSKGWVKNKDRCYYVSTFEASFDTAMQECSNCDSRLLDINSVDEAGFVLRLLGPRMLTYWVGKCANGNYASGLLYMASSRSSSCSECTSRRWARNCLHDKYRFICEKSTPDRSDIPEKIRLLCQQPGEPT